MNQRGFILFDIDGVIRDVTDSYRLAIQETVNYFCNWKPSTEDIDRLKSEGIWNNDWDTSLELIKRFRKGKNLLIDLPKRKNVIEVFSDHYFGGDPNGENKNWKGFIKNEPLLVNKDFFNQLTKQGFLWGFVSGAEPPSAKYLLETRLGLKNPPLIAMGDAPDKPDPRGLIQLASLLSPIPLGIDSPPICYLGDTVADVWTVNRARKALPSQKFFSYAVAPPHLHKKTNDNARLKYEKQLEEAGADKVLSSTSEVINHLLQW